MKKILIFGGTIEGRQLVEALCGTKVKVYVCVTTHYGATLLPEGNNVEVLTDRLDKEGMVALFRRITPDLCLDATHPYAIEVTHNIITACEEKGVSYIRVVRGYEKTEVSPDNLRVFETISQAADFLAITTGRILITTGSKELEAYKVIPDYTNRCIARVLSTKEVLDKCGRLGFRGKNVIAMQGPFSVEMNELMLRENNIKWLVTKSSGKAGGYPEKCEAAMRAGVSLVVIGRPTEQGTCEKSVSETLQYLMEAYGIIIRKPEIYLVGMGPGEESLLTGEARKVLQSADVLIGSSRALEVWKDYRKVPHFISYSPKEIKDYIRQHPQYYKIAICYSGDVGFYSGANGMKEILKEYKVELISGVSSIIYFLNRLGEAWDKVTLASCHGREIDMVSLLQKNTKVCVLLGNKDSVAVLCQNLLQQGKKDIEITVGERLSYESERFTKGTPETFANWEFDALSVALFEKVQSPEGE